LPQNNDNRKKKEKEKKQKIFEQLEREQKSLLHDLNMNVINSNQSTGHDKIHAMYNLLEIAGIDLEEMHYNWRRLVRL
jgi:hypothetical protein